jgi:lipopolysaccharide/colanic/teichoic acid biosynthesis glycosyltransferase
MKRIMDILGSALAPVFFSRLFSAVAMASKMTSKVPALQGARGTA